MAAGHREHIAKQLLQAHVSESDGRILIQRKPPGVKPTAHNHSNGGRPVRRGQKNPHRLPSPSSAVLEQREQGWNDRFFRDTPSQPKRPQRTSHVSGDEATSSSTQDQKERKIREERQQYGHGESASHKHQRPGVGRLAPIGSLPVPPREPDTTSSNEEKLRFKVLKAIDVRETLIYQLNALILCTPVQEALVMAASRVATNDTSAALQLKPRATMALAVGGSTTMVSSGVHAMSNAREATRLAQQLASDLQVTGIQVVEGMVEWMLEAGAKAAKPPEFLWRGRNYFLKMETDLDFAGPELRARGVELDCFSSGNSLCIRPDQRLGRVLAAQSIVHEMVTMARQQQQQQEQQDATPRSGRKVSGRKEKKSPRSKSHRTPRRQKETSPRASSSAAVSSETAAALLALQGADEMILATSGPGDDDDDDDYGDEANGFSAAKSAMHEPAERKSNQEEATGFEDPEAEKELVNLLDESLGDTIAPATTAPPATLSVLSESAKSSARDEYENSFDDDEAEDISTLPAESEMKSSATPTEPQGEDDDPSDEQQGGENAHQHQQTQSSKLAAEAADSSNQVEEDEREPESTVALNPPSPVDDDSNRWQRVAELLRDLKGESSDDLSGDELQQRAMWADRRQRQLDAALGQSVHTWGKDAFDGALTQLLLPLRSEIVTLCEDPVCTSLQLRERVLRECLHVLDDQCHALSASIHQEIESSNPLVSEVDFADLVDVARKQFHDEETSVSLRSVSRAIEVTLMLRESSTPEVSRGFSRLIQVFYPYLINQRRDRLVHSWQQVAQLLKNHLAVDVQHASCLLDATCKVLLLNIAALERNASEGEDSAVPKLTLVCDRANVLESSVAAAHAKWLSKASSPPAVQLYPFFKSSFGEKRVDGVQVEEGEGKGPLKEWFTLVASDLTAKWRAVPVPADSPASGAVDDFDPVLVNGNKLVVDRLDTVLKSGYKVEWHSPSDQTTVSRIVNSCDASTGAYLLDRGGLPNQSFAVLELRVFQPKTAVLEYIQASESYWLNESLADTPPNRQTLLFLGWFLANALAQQCALQLRLHRLLFELLLDSARVVTLQDLESLDPSLWTAMQQMKRMKPAEFASYLEFEGVADASSLSVDEYIARTVDEKYGLQSSLAWQLQELRSGFTRFFTPNDLRVASITARDLVDQLCADAAHSGDEDLDLEQVFRVALDPDFASCAPLRRSFWAAVKGFNPRLKRQLVKFITGVETLPQPNTEFLRIEMPFPAVSPTDLSKTLQMLPQSHTCDNTLELPHYWRALCWKAGHVAERANATIESELVALMSEKLRLAAEYSAGYGLDGTAATTASLSSVLPGGHSSQDQQLAAQESYDSLDLPALGEGSMTSGRGSRPGSRTPVATGRREDQPSEQESNRNANQGEQLRENDEEATSAGAAVAAEKDEEAYGAEDWEEEELAE